MPGIMRDVVVILPGIGGSVLREGGRDLWSISGQAIWRFLRSLGGSLQDLRLKQGVEAVGLIDGFHLVPGLTRGRGYGPLADMIRERFEVTQGDLNVPSVANFFEFAYDWRLDNRLNALKLQALVEDRLPRWREASNDKGAKVILVCHSMGGLVARYYAEVLGGWEHCRLLITLGTPHRGSPESLNVLTGGLRMPIIDLARLYRSFDSAYQLLPIYELVKVGGLHRRVAEIESTPGLDFDLVGRAKEGLEFHRQIESAVESNRREARYHDEYKVVPVVGTRQPTLQTAVWGERGISFDEKEPPPGLDETQADGDGTVPHVSAIPIELKPLDAVPFPQRHGALQSCPRVLDFVAGLLELAQLRGLTHLRGAQEQARLATPPGITLDVGEFYAAGLPFEISARVQEGAAPGLTLEATLLGVDPPRAAVRLPLAREGEEHRLVLPTLAEGLYSVQVRALRGGPNAPPPVQEVFEVLPAEAALTEGV